MAGDDLSTLGISRMPGHLIRRLHQVSVSIVLEEASKAGFDLTPVQYAVLSALQTCPGIDQATLAGVIAYDRVTIGGVIDRLVQKGLIRREVSARDRRARELHLSPQGLKVQESLTPVVRNAQAMILAGLDEKEQETFVELLHKATEAVNEQSRAPQRLPGK